MERKGGCVREGGQEQERKTSQFTSGAYTNKTSLIHTAMPTEASHPHPTGAHKHGGITALPSPQGRADSAAESVRKVLLLSVLPFASVNTVASHVAQRTSLTSTMRTECLLGEGVREVHL